MVVWGANPAENHPACIAHINRARFPKQYYAASDPRSSKTAAKLIVIDPRKTRTALMGETNGDRYMRIRPGTDIAFGNGLLRYMIAKMETATSWSPTAAKTAFFAYPEPDRQRHVLHRRQRRHHGEHVGDSRSLATSKYTDARFLVDCRPAPTTSRDRV